MFATHDVSDETKAHMYLPPPLLGDGDLGCCDSVTALFRDNRFLSHLWSTVVFPHELP